MQNVCELKVGDLLFYDNGAICVVCCTRNKRYKLYYVDEESCFMANTPKSLFNRVSLDYVKVVRV